MNHRLPYLNAGCGHHFHPSWTNLDFVATASEVIAHNLLDGIPFDNQSFEVVYHSHVLEHFTKADGEHFLAECYRVLKPGGILRIAIPDLERAAQDYLHALSLALQKPDDPIAAANHEWMITELIDQAARNQSGGQMAKYLFRPQIANEDFVFQRIGEEGRQLRHWYLEQQDKKKSPPPPQAPAPTDTPLRRLKDAIKVLLGRRIYQAPTPEQTEMTRYASVGKFRLSGEIHQWMYDRYSLPQLLQKIGFGEVFITNAFESRIPNWTQFGLDHIGDQVRKPDSLFVEAIKIQA
ncbi:MAG: methyltransferase domain-containing protein [Bernardetiaceae bacterium]